MLKSCVKLTRDDNELQAFQRRHELRDIVSNHYKELLLYSTQNKTTLISERINKDSN